MMGQVAIRLGVVGEGGHSSFCADKRPCSLQEAFERELLCVCVCVCVLTDVCTVCEGLDADKRPC